METPNKLRGLVLSGGASRRMGRDKGLISQDSLLWVDRAGILLQSVGLSVSVVIRETQRIEYKKVVLPDFELLSDLDLPLGGPLKGLLSFHRFYPQHDVLVLPCDMPNLTSNLLRELIELYDKKPDFEAWVFKAQGTLQPFPGIYSARLLASTLKKSEDDTLHKHGLTHLLNAAEIICETIPDSSTFQNSNTNSDI